MSSDFTIIDTDIVTLLQLLEAPTRDLIQLNSFFQKP